MNIVEAVKTEKRFRRKGTKEWFEMENTAGNNYYPTLLMDKEGLLADDYEVEEIRLALTAEQIRLAFDKARMESDKRPDYMYKEELLEWTLTELGFNNNNKE